MTYKYWRKIFNFSRELLHNFIVYWDAKWSTLKTRNILIKIRGNKIITRDRNSFIVDVPGHHFSAPFSGQGPLKPLQIIIIKLLKICGNILAKQLCAWYKHELLDMLSLGYFINFENIERPKKWWWERL